MNHPLPQPLAPGKAASDATQVAALCWRMADKRIEVLLITSRDTGRWVIPKGWPIAGLDAPASAAREAWEEAGVQGLVDQTPLGRYHYDKVTRAGRVRRCTVTVFALYVREMENAFPEQGQRQLKWVMPGEAADLLAEADLRALMRAAAEDPGFLHHPLRQGIAGP